MAAGAASRRLSPAPPGRRLAPLTHENTMVGHESRLNTHLGGFSNHGVLETGTARILLRGRRLAPLTNELGTPDPN